MDIELTGDNGSLSPDMLQGMAEELPQNINVNIDDPADTLGLSASAPLAESQATPAAAPATPEEDKQEDKSFLDYLMDVGKGIANGPVNAANETIDLIGTMAQGGEEFDVVQTAAEYGVDMGNFGETETAPGKMAQDISTFLAGFLTGGALLKGAKLLQGSSKAAIVGRGAAKSFYSTVTGFDGHEEMLSNAMQESPALRNVITENLAVSKDDNELVGRLKHGFEDLGIGMALEAAIAIVGVYRASKAATKAAKEQVYTETVERIRQTREEAVSVHSPDTVSPITPPATGAKAPLKDVFRPDSLIDPAALKSLVGDGKAKTLGEALDTLARSDARHRVTGLDILRNEHGFDFIKHVKESLKEAGSSKEVVTATDDVVSSLTSSTDELVQRYGMNMQGRPLPAVRLPLPARPLRPLTT